MYRGAAAMLVTDNDNPSVSECVAENMVSVQCPLVYTLYSTGQRWSPYLLPLRGQASRLQSSLSLTHTFSFFRV